jgi:hypothetical protein
MLHNTRSAIAQSMLMLLAHQSFYPSALATTEALTQEDMQPEVGGALAGDGRHGSTKPSLGRVTRNMANS